MEIKELKEDNQRHRKTDKAWDILCDKLDIGRQIFEKGEFIITSQEINTVVRSEYRSIYGENAPDARNLLKFDFSVDQPNVFRANNWSIMPIGHDRYKISDFKMYQELEYEKKEIKEKHFPQWIVGIDAANLTSEPTAQAVADITGMIQTIMETDKNPIATLSGKKGTGDLKFEIETISKDRKEVHIDGWQSEIDGLYETADTALIVESKMKAPKDFNIRQIFIPTLIYKQMLEKSGLTKKILAVYFIYTNKTFIFNVYEFSDLGFYNSLNLRERYYFRLCDGESFSVDDLAELVDSTESHVEPANFPDPIPFPQANNVYVMSDLLESLKQATVAVEVDGKEELLQAGTTDAFVAQNKYAPRQADYYYNLLRYFGLAYKDESGVVTASKLGSDYIEANGSVRIKLLVQGMLQSSVFNRLLRLRVASKRPVTDDEVIQSMKLEQIKLGEGTMKRRASTVRALIEYVFANLD